MTDPKKQQLEKFNSVEEVIEFLYDLFETRDVIDHDDLAVLISLMMDRKLDAQEIGNAHDLFYEKYRDNSPIK